MAIVTTRTENNAVELRALAVRSRFAVELSVFSWVIAARLPGIHKSRLHRLERGDTAALLRTIADLPAEASTKSGTAAEVT